MPAYRCSHAEVVSDQDMLYIDSQARSVSSFHRMPLGGASAAPAKSTTFLILEKSDFVDWTSNGDGV